MGTVAARRRTALGVVATLLLAMVALAPATESSSTRRAEALRPQAHAAKTGRLGGELARLARTGSSQLVRVEIRARRPAAVRALVRRSGGRVRLSYRRLVEAQVPARALDALSMSGSVMYTREPIRPVAEAVGGEGVGATGARAWHNAGLRGAGTKVAIVDLGFAGWRDSRRNGDLPSATSTLDLCPGSFDGPLATSHGTAVAEIVAEMAPAARLYLICVDSLAALGRAKDYAVANGIQIVNHSASWFNTSRGDDTGGPETPTGIVAAARAAGILWVNAAGNRAQQHWSGTFVDADGDGIHEFSPGDEGNTLFLAGGQRTCAALKWDAWPATAIDYDLYLARASDGQTVAASNDVQDGTQPPTELLCYANPGAQGQVLALGVDGRPGPAPRLDLFVYPGPNLEYQVADGSLTEPGSSSAALAVGAVCWRTNGLETFSGRGPTIDGRAKPDLAGPDWVSSFTFGPFRGCGSQTGFGGTSAATPHVAGAAALVKGANPSFGPAELQGFLETQAVDLGAPGRDNVFGAGRLALGPSPRPALRACVVPRVTGGTVASARTRLVRAGCTLGRVRTARSRSRKGLVVGQSPSAGRHVGFRTRVNLTVSRGRR